VQRRICVLCCLFRSRSGWVGGSGDTAGASIGAQAGVHPPVVTVGRRRGPWLILAIVFTSIGLALALAAGIGAPFLLVGIGFSVVAFSQRRRSRSQPAR
jgi:membrane protein YqaA with SNARE-associated domain